MRISNFCGKMSFKTLTKLILIVGTLLMHTNCIIIQEVFDGPMIKQSIMVVEPTNDHTSRNLQTTTPRGFKIKAQFYSYQDETAKIVASPSTFSYFQKLFSISAKYFESTIKVTSILTQFQTKYTSTKCKAIDMPQKYIDNGFDVTTVDSLFFVLMVNAPTVSTDSYSLPCGLVRWPIYSYMVINTPLFDTDVTKTGIFHQNIYRIIRSTLGALGWSSQFIFSKEDVFFTSYDLNTRLNIGQRVQSLSNRNYIVTPNVKSYVQTYFNCSNAAIGAIIENQDRATDIVGTTILQKSVFYDQIMTQYPFLNLNNPTTYKITPLTFALLKDTGFYHSFDTTLTQSAFFGKNGGCDFAMDAETSPYTMREFCSVASSTTQSCDFYGLDGGSCKNDDGRSKNEASTISPQLSKLCSLAEMRINSPKDPESVGTRSRCLNSGSSSKCYNAECISGGIKITIDCQEAVCVPGANSVTIGSTQVTCPSSQEVFCSRKNCQDWCGGDGLCVNGKCTNCMNIHPQCAKCDNSGNCLKCMKGFTPTTNGLSCQTCQNAISNCNDCYKESSTVKCNYCASNFFPSLNKESCVGCPNIIQNCKSCSSGCSVQCLECVNSNYFLSPDKKSCLPCESQVKGCLSCSGLSGGVLCTQCGSGVFPSESQKQCLSCSSVIPNCKTCTTENGVTKCLECGAGLTLLSDKSKCIGCVSSMSNCFNCADGNDCKECNNGYFWSISAKTCVDCSISIAQCISCSMQNNKVTCIQCADSFYVDPINLICKSCATITNCKNCIKQTVNLICTECTDGMYFNSASKQCELCTLSNCKECLNNEPTMKCSSCLSNFYFDGSKCSSCGTLTNCRSCSMLSSKLVCNQCNDGFIADPVSGGCQSCGINGCQRCVLNLNKVKVCTKCIAPLVRSNDRLSCVSCNSGEVINCNQCTSDGFNDLCSSCNLGYVLSSDQIQCTKCTQNVISNCAECGSNGQVANCKTCKIGYVLSSDKLSCVACSASSISKCQECTSDGVNILCTKCLTGFSLNSAKTECSICATTAIKNCLSCSSDGIQTICSECLPNFILGNDKLTCQNCQPSSMPNCYECTTIANLKTCSACIKPYVLNAAQSICSPCSSSFTPKCLSCNSDGVNAQCTQCDIGFIPSSTKSTCQQCSSTDITFCSQCTTNGVITTCSQCLNGYIPSVNGLSCIPCSQSGIAKCSKCSSDGIKNLCSGCNSGFFLSSNKDSCISCVASSISGCSECSTDGLVTICTKCQTGFILSSDKKQCSPCLNTFTDKCKSCTSDGYKNICSFCENGYTLTNNMLTCQLCQPSLIPNCVICETDGIINLCNKCEQGYSLTSNHNACQKCLGVVVRSAGVQKCLTCSTVIANCLTCTSDTSVVCQQCSNGLVPNAAKDQCVTCNGLVSNCKTCFANGITTQCSICEQGFYLDQSTKQCVKCSSSLNGCQECSWSFSSNKLVCSLCVSNGKYLNGGQCNNCASFCTKCFGSPTNCTNRPMLSPLRGTCIFNGAVVSCDVGCSVCTCTSLTSTICYRPVEGYVAKSNGLIIKCNAGCSKCDQNTNPPICIECTTGFTINNNDCVSCANGCSSCLPSKPNECTSCSSGFYLSTIKSCVKCEVNGCGECTNKGLSCAKCLDGYWLSVDGSTCSECLTSCSICDKLNIKNCLGCSDGFYLQNNVCKECNEGCLKCTNALTCTTCFEGLIQSSIDPSKCVKRCQFPCLSCQDGAPTKCLDCLSGYTLSGNKCVELKTCVGGCITCPLGYFLNQGQCSQCSDENCANCQTGNCTSCMDGYYLKNGVCSKCSIQGCGICLDESRCMECVAGYTKNSLNTQKSCSKCLSPCLTCSGSVQKCLTCIDGYAKKGWKCKSKLFVKYTTKIDTDLNKFIGDQLHVSFRDYLLGKLKETKIQASTFVSFESGSTVVSGQIQATSDDSDNDICKRSSQIRDALSGDTSVNGAKVISTEVTTSNGQQCDEKKKPESNNVLTLVLATTIPMGFIALAGGLIYKIKSQREEERKKKQGFQPGVNSSESIEKTDHVSMTEKLESVPY